MDADERHRRDEEADLLSRLRSRTRSVGPGVGFLTRRAETYILKSMQATTDNLFEQMTQRLIAEFDPERIILFGSYAWGEADKGSDVDLMVIVRHSDLSPYERAIQAHACLSEFDVPKDVIVKTQAEFNFFRDVRASLEYKILRQGRVLYERSQDAVGSNVAGQGSA